MILRAQADFLKRRTQGLLLGVVTPVEADHLTKINFDLAAGPTGEFRQRLLAVDHPKHRVYPADVEADCFDEQSQLLPHLHSRYATGARTATTEEQFLEILEAIFNSSSTVSLMQAMIAKSNEENAPPDLF
jgi:hypothetical protein